MEKTPHVLIPGDPLAREIADKLKAMQQVMKRFTVDGEVLVAKRGGVVIDLPLEVEEAPPMPIAWSPKHHDVMGIIYTAVMQIKAMPHRALPLTRAELLDEFKADKRAVRRLDGWGFITQRVIEVNKGAAKGSARAVYYFTSKGRAYVREHFDPEYGLPRQPESAAAAGEVPGDHG
jgi:hypothetical protein